MTYDDDCPNCRVEGGVKLCRLHAAAPRLLAAGKAIVAILPDGNSPTHLAMKAAIAYAEERPPQEASA